MASNAPVAKSAPDGPLSFMTKLSPVVYFYKPDPTCTPAPSAPRLLLLAAWMGAQEGHIAKYILPYQALYPTSPILLLRYNPNHFMSIFPWRRRAIEAQYAVAVPILRQIAESPQPNRPSSAPEILIHIWSNGGSISLTTVYNHFKKATTAAFPAHTIVFDSVPGVFNHAAGVRVMSQGLSLMMRVWVVPLLHVMGAWYWLLHIAIGSRIKSLRGFLEVLAEGHNDLSAEFRGRARTEIRRSYLYGPQDEIVSEKHVENHAHDARSKGMRIRTERFVGSKHVQHVRADQERYWKVVRETWEGVGGGGDGDR